MEISSPQTAAQSAAAPTAATGSATKIGADFDTFLTMLTTQMKNQDPLNPVESSDFAVQLATFSGVEQQVQTNDLLRAMGAAGAMGGLSQFAGWVGMEARSTAPVQVTGTPVELHYEMPLGSVASEIVLRNGSGMEVRRMAVTGPGPMVWDGTATSGGTLPAGDYTATLESRDSAGKVTTDTVASYARVAELRAEPTGAIAILDNGARVPVSDITALRAAD
jgi:flagellar basal-body rod modification protein FlgD